MISERVGANVKVIEDMEERSVGLVQKFGEFTGWLNIFGGTSAEFSAEQSSFQILPSWHSARAKRTQTKAVAACSREADEQS